MKKISIIMPVYNKERYVEKAIKSIVNQTFKEFELLIVDDGSTDQSGVICDDWAEKDSRITVFHIKNGGVSNARNYALSYANGEYITFIDSDDYIGSTYLENLYECMVTQNVDMVISGYTKVWENNTKEEVLKMPILGKHSLQEILPFFAKWQNETGLFGYCVAKIFKRKLIEEIYFDINLRLAEDFDFYLRVYKYIDQIYFDFHTDYYYLQETSNSSSIVNDYDIDYMAQLKLNLRYKKFLKEQGVYNKENREIVEMKISNYVYFSLFYCKLKEFDKRFAELHTMYQEEGIKLCTAGRIPQYFLFLLRSNSLKTAKISLISYRWIRNLIKGK